MTIQLITYLHQARPIALSLPVLEPGGFPVADLAEFDMVTGVVTSSSSHLRSQPPRRAALCVPTEQLLTQGLELPHAVRPPEGLRKDPPPFYLRRRIGG